MKVELVLAENHFDDNNNGYRYGIYELDDDGEIVNDYVEWFKTKEERDKVIKENNMIVMYEEEEK